MLDSKKAPSITLVMISFNDENILDECLGSIFNQDYPRNKLGVLLVDGGSTDNTIQIAKKYGKRVRIISRPDLKDRPDVRSKIAMTEPKTDLIMISSADNRFGEKDCLSEMVRPLVESNAVGSETFRYGFRSSDPLLSRYFALIGGIDPVAIELGKADRAPYDSEKWHSFGKSTDKGHYYLIEFEPKLERIPTIGANGFIMRRAAIEKIGGIRNADHTGTCVRLIRRGYNQFAFVKNKTIVHFIRIDLLSFLKRRLLYANMYSASRIKREYFVFTKHDLPRLLWICLAYPTLIIPFIRALKGYLKKPDAAWFLHPLICLAFFWGYALFFSKKAAKTALEWLKHRF
ncbi:MAG: glycosyltransferase [Candidatus Micrarchaeia archaeon]|jgi:glycosyltransferase involved in cell wall biosynthesis